MRAMRRKVEARNSRISAVKLYGEDLDELVGFFQRYCQSWQLSDKDHIYDSLNELKESGKKDLTNLEILGTNPSVRLWLKNNGSWLQQINDKSEMTPEEIDKRDALFWQ